MNRLLPLALVATLTAPSLASAQAPAPAADDVADGGGSAPTATRDEDDEDDEDDEEDRDRHVWIDVAAGYSYINLVALDQSGLTPEPQLVKSSGYGFEAGAGLQFSWFRFGVSGSHSVYDHFSASTAELDLTFSIPFPVVQPYLETGFGYGFIHDVRAPAQGGGSFVTPIRGIAIDLGLGLDFQLSDAIQFGVAVDASLLNLQRQGVNEISSITNFDATEPGSSLGLQLHGYARLTFQF